MYFTYLDLSTLPDNLLVSIHELSARKDIFPGAHTVHYKQYELSNAELTDMISKIFPFTIKASYQLMTNGFRIHKDKGRNDAFNYLINIGNATTIIYDEDKKQYCLKRTLNRFVGTISMFLNFTVFKNNSKRVSITVTPLIENPLERLTSVIRN